MMRLARIPLVLLLLAAAPALALAETQYRFEVFGGATLPAGKDFEISTPQATVPMRGTQEFSLGGRAGVRFGADGRSNWGQDFIYSYGANASRIINNNNGARFAFTVRSQQLSYNALWYPGGLRRGRAFPYLTAGIGGAFNMLSQSAINEALDPNRAGLGKLKSDNIFMFNAGGGARWRVNRLYGFRVDVRDYMSRAVRYGLPKRSDDPNATVFPIGGIFHQLEVSIAFIYYFK